MNNLNRIYSVKYVKDARRPVRRLQSLSMHSSLAMGALQRGGLLSGGLGCRPGGGGSLRR